MARKKTATNRRRKTKEEARRDSELKDWIEIVLLVTVTIIAYTKMGVVGIFLNRLCNYLFGSVYALVLAVIIGQILITMVNRRSGNTSSKNPIAIYLILIAVLLSCSYAVNKDSGIKGFALLQQYGEETPNLFSGTSKMIVGGGILGSLLLSLSTYALDYSGTLLIIVVLFVIAALLLVSLEVYKQAFRTIRDYFSTTEEYVDDDNEDEEFTEPLEETQEIKASSHHSFWSFFKKKHHHEEEEDPKQMVPVSMTNILADDCGGKEPDGEKTERSAIDIRADEADIEVKNDVHIGPYDLPGVVAKAIAEEGDSIFIHVEDLIDRTQTFALPPASESSRYISEKTEIPSPDQSCDTKRYEPLKEDTKQKFANGMKRNRPYQLPPVRLLDPLPLKDRNDPNKTAAVQKGEQLIQVLQNFDIETRLIDTHIGPAVTKFEIRPDANVKVSRILGLADDIKMQLAVRDVRIEAPIPGHNAVGIEIPNVKAVPVKMRELLAKIPEKEKNQPLLVMLGKDLMGNSITCHLDKMPHLLIAGATGSGKSVCINSIIISLLLRTKPDDVKLLLIDPKKVEFTPYQKIPHLIGKVINDPLQANNALKVIVKIMEERYDVFAKSGVRNIQGFNHMADTFPHQSEQDSPKPKKMPYIVVIIDEMADLMAVAGKEVEGSIQRITQLARAAGIHLIVATQRPSVDVITGVIKANIPSRIAFAVSSMIDSKTILDHGGAERLLGNGDMLYMPIGANAPVRVQGVFVTDEEVHHITEFVADEAVPMYDDAFIRLEGVNDEDGIGAISTIAEDPLFEEAKNYVIRMQRASTSLLQRHFGIGYNRAARMIDLLEEQEIIGPAQGAKPRNVLVKGDVSGAE